jgi:nucleoside-diphosphate-sugar epimerase
MLPAAALVLGGTGFIGSRITNALHEAGVRAVPFHRSASRTHGVCRRAEHVHGDHGTADDLERAMRDVEPDVVVDVVAYTQADGEQLAAACAGRVDRVVLVSSQDVYRAYGRYIAIEPGPLEPLPYTTDSPLRSVLFPYRTFGGDPDYEKILAERALASSSGFDLSVVRLPMVYGPGDRGGRVAPYVEDLTYGRDVRVPLPSAAWRCTRGYVDDVAEAVALVAIAPAAAGEVYNLGEPDALTTEEWARAVCEAYGATPDVHMTKASAASSDESIRRLDWNQDLIADTEQIRSQLGYDERVGRARGLAATVAWEAIVRRAANRPTTEA